MVRLCVLHNAACYVLLSQLLKIGFTVRLGCINKDSMGHWHFMSSPLVYNSGLVWIGWAPRMLQMLRNADMRTTEPG